jgi:hypothetical protein
MTRRIVGLAIGVGAFALVTCGARPASAKDDACFFQGSMYSDGGRSCQAGRQFKCDDGEWKKEDKDCQPERNARMSKSCEFGDVSYGTGSAKCDHGTQYRCEDGTWRKLDATCPVGDAPMRVMPSGRECMFDGATVAHNSTICRSGSTYACSNGEWVNLGTECR